MPAIDEQMRDALASLGETSAVVAQTLSAEGCEGKRETGEACPVFNYLNKRFPGQVKEVDYEDVWFDDFHESVELPEQVQEFIHQFDNGEYQELAVE